MQALLVSMGWRVETIWECETTDPTVLDSKLSEYFGSQQNPST